MTTRFQIGSIYEAYGAFHIKTRTLRGKIVAQVLYASRLPGNHGQTRLSETKFYYGFAIGNRTNGIVITSQMARADNRLYRA